MELLKNSVRALNEQLFTVRNMPPLRISRYQAWATSIAVQRPRWTPCTPARRVHAPQERRQWLSEKQELLQRAPTDGARSAASASAAMGAYSADGHAAAAGGSFSAVQPPAQRSISAAGTLSGRRSQQGLLDRPAGVERPGASQDAVPRR